MTRAPLAIVAVLLAGCGSKPITTDFDKLTQDLIYGSLALSPVNATATGYHTHNGIPLDELLDDYSAPGVDQQRQFYQGIQTRMMAVDLASLDKEQKADLEIMKDAVGLALLDLNTIQSFKHNPTVYVELAGNALFNPYMLNYAPKREALSADHPAPGKDAGPVRAGEDRTGGRPRSLEPCRAGGKRRQCRVDRQDPSGRGSRGPEGRLRPGRHRGARLTARVHGVPEGHSLQEDQRLASGQGQLRQEVSVRPAYRQSAGAAAFGSRSGFENAPRDAAKLSAPKTVKQALDEIAKQHATPDTYLDAARKTLEQATAFVRDKGLVTLSSRSNLQVVETPEFLRGIYGVGGFNPAPALEPQLGAFYWITPIPKSWPKERVESKLREYNNYGMQELTIHEAMPGHYVQFEYANDVQPQARRVLRTVFQQHPVCRRLGVLYPADDVRRRLSEQQ